MSLYTTALRRHHSRVCSEEQPVYGIVLSLWSGDVREPLSSEAGPLQGMGHDKIIEERSVLLPDLVLLIDDPLLHCLIISWVGGSK